MKSSSILSFLVLVLSACATTSGQPPRFRSGPGPVDVILAPPTSFTPTRSYHLNDDVLVGPRGSMEVLRVADIPLACADGLGACLSDGDQISQTIVDGWAARFTRDPGVSLVAARSLFWDIKRQIGALEVTYKDKKTEENSSWWHSDIETTARVALVPTTKGLCTITLIAGVGFGRSSEKAWREVIDGISVAPGALPTTGVFEPRQ